MLARSRSASPYKRSPAVFQKRHLRAILIACLLPIHSERSRHTRQILVQAPGADAQSIAVRSVILPDHVSAILADADSRKSLVAWPSHRQWVLTSLFAISRLGRSLKRHGRNQPKEGQPLASAQQ